MSKSSGFAEEVLRRKVSTTKLLLTLLLMLSALNLFFVIAQTIRIARGVEKPEPAALITIALGVSVFLLFAYMRLRVLRRSYKTVFIIMSASSTAAAFILTWLFGAGNWIIFALLSINILSASIVLGIRPTAKIAIGYGLIWLVLNSLHILGLVSYAPQETSTTTVGTVILVSLVALFAYITKIGYGEIEHSYEQAYKYSAALEELNLELDNLVKRRTAQLESSHEREMQSLYSAAIFGRTTKSLVHDIATPLSTISGTLALLKDQELGSDNRELVELSNKAIEQINRLMSHSQSLVAGQVSNENFNVNAIIRNLVGILKHQLETYKIKVDIKVDKSLTLYGSGGIFERIVLNLLTNAIDAIIVQRNSGGKISITVTKLATETLLSVEDNGVGIEPEELDRIFEADYSLKQNRQNMGMGLYFVSQSVHKYFDGHIAVDSEPAKGTKFRIYLRPATQEILNEQN